MLRIGRSDYLELVEKSKCWRDVVRVGASSMANGRSLLVDP